MIVLEFLRHNLRLSEAEAAESIGLLPVDYGLIEHALQPPDEATAYRLAAMFGYGYEALFVNVRELVDEGLLKRDLIR